MHVLPKTRAPKKNVPDISHSRAAVRADALARVRVLTYKNLIMKIERVRPIYRVKTKQDRSRAEANSRRGCTFVSLRARLCEGWRGLSVSGHRRRARSRTVHFFPLISSFRSTVLGSRLSAAAAADPFVTKICCDRRGGAATSR